VLHLVVVVIVVFLWCVGDCLICAPFLAYVGAFSWEYRDRLVYQTWQAGVLERGIPISQPFRIEQLLTTEVL